MFGTNLSLNSHIIKDFELDFSNNSNRNLMIKLKSSDNCSGRKILLMNEFSLILQETLKGEICYKLSKLSLHKVKCNYTTKFIIFCYCRFSSLLEPITVPTPLLAAASIQKNIFWPQDYHIKSTKKMLFSLKT